MITDRLDRQDLAVSVLSPGNSWGFGQIIAIILLLLPFISFFEVVYGKDPLAEDSITLVIRYRY